VISFFMLKAACSKAQYYDSTSLTYADGYKKLQKLIHSEISISDVASTDSFYNKPYSFYQVLFKVDKNGAIGDIWINSIYDSALSSILLLAMIKSNGHWTNHSGTGVMAILPVYIYNVSKENFENMSPGQIYDIKDKTESLKIFNSYYQNWGPGKTVMLKPIKIVEYGIVH
jgi:hypothetical protein